MKKFFIKQFFYVLFAFGFLLATANVNHVQAEKSTFFATVSVFQESSDSPTGRCYGPYYVATKPLLVDVYDISYNGVSIKTPQDVVRNNYVAPRVNTKLVKRVGWKCEKYLTEVDSGHMPICSLDISMYDNLAPDETVMRHVRVKVLDANFRASKLFDEQIPVHIKQWVDETQCFTEPTAGFALCFQIPGENKDAFERCATCFKTGGIWTAVGCIPSNPESIINTIIRIGLTLGGGIVLVMILVGAFMLSTSKGDPKKTQEAKELITSAIIGLLFIIFSITILQFIGASVIKIPGFGE